MVDTRNRDRMKSQSAMEYLMTYGWSILIIAVVLGALSFLGIFNPVTFAPKATAGGCQVVKNSELGISNLEGSCNNQMPQYVAQFDGPVGGCCGGSHTNYIDVGNKSIYNQIKSNVTIVGWVKLNALTTNDTGNYNYIVSNDGDCCSTHLYGYAVWMSSSSFIF